MYWKKSFPLLSILPLSSRIIGNVCERLKSSLARVIFFFFLMSEWNSLGGEITWSLWAKRSIPGASRGRSAASGKSYVKVEKDCEWHHCFLPKSGWTIADDFLFSAKNHYSVKFKRPGFIQATHSSLECRQFLLKYAFADRKVGRYFSSHKINLLAIICWYNACKNTNIISKFTCSHKS